MHNEQITADRWSTIIFSPYWFGTRTLFFVVNFLNHRPSNTEGLCLNNINTTKHAKGDVILLVVFAKLLTASLSKRMAQVVQNEVKYSTIPVLLPRLFLHNLQECLKCRLFHRIRFCQSLDISDQHLISTPYYFSKTKAVKQC